MCLPSQVSIQVSFSPSQLEGWLANLRIKATSHQFQVSFHDLPGMAAYGDQQ